MKEQLVCDRCKSYADDSDEECWNCGNTIFEYIEISPDTTRDDELNQMLIEVRHGRMSNTKALRLIAQYGIQERIDEHKTLWDIVPMEAEHVGTVKDISELRVVKLTALKDNKEVK